MKEWQKMKKYIVNWKDIKKNMTKTDSIKKWLILLAGLQIFLTMAFLCYLVTVSAYQNYNMATHRYFQTGEQLLDRVEISVKELEQATFFPAQLYTQNNDSYLCSTLREGPILKNFRFYSYFNTQAQNRFTTDSTSFIALYDLEGNGVYTSKGANYGISFLDKEKAEWYKKISAYKTGTPLLIAAQEFRGSGMNMRDGGSLCIGRGILDLNTIKIVGYCVAGIDTSYLENYFEQNRQAPNQRFAVYKDGKLLYGNIEQEESYQGFVKENLKKTERKENYQSRKLKHSDKNSCVYNVIGHANGYTLVLQTPLSDIFGNMGRIQMLNIIPIGMILGGIIFLIFQMVGRILKALNRLIEACNHFELGHINKVSKEGLPEEFQTLVSSFNKMSKRIDLLIHEVFVKQQEKQETELQLLRTQINPHYLYNTLEIMHMKAYMCQDYETSTMAELLGQNLQYGLRNTTKEVSLEEEIHQLNIYRAILAYQYNERIQFNICIDRELYSYHVLKLVFQPIVENAVIHGITDSHQILHIDILGYRDEDRLYIQVSDDGCGMSEEQLEMLRHDIDSPSSNSIGLRNVCRRISLNYGPKYKVSIESAEGMGTMIMLCFPWKDNMSDDMEEELTKKEEQDVPDPISR